MNWLGFKKGTWAFASIVMKSKTDKIAVLIDIYLIGV
jgi:hypothetical protein